MGRPGADLGSHDRVVDPALMFELRLLCPEDRVETLSDALEIACFELKVAPHESSGWLHRAYALRRASDGGLSQAWDALLPAAKMFPAEPIIAYNLSCYACQMQQLDIARHWLNRAVAAGQKEAIKKMALADADLQPLWTEIKEL